MIAASGNEFPVLSKVQKWADELRRSRDRLESDRMSGRPATVVNEEIMVMGDR